MTGHPGDQRRFVDSAGTRFSSYRAAWVLFAAHLGLIVFSTVAMLTVLNGMVEVTGEPAATIARLSFRFAGPLYVLLGTASALAFVGAAVGWRKALVVGGVASALALGAELAGTSVGLPFGDYQYSGMLGYRVLGLVPFPIPLSWFYMLLGSLVIVARLTSDEGHVRARWIWAVGAGLLMVAWDVSMDPAMVRTGHWSWGSGAMFRDAGLPGWLLAFFTADAFYGMPLSNWFGWFVTATLIARVMLGFLPPGQVRTSLAPSPLPVALYLANGIMPVALCLRDGLWWAAALGAAAMMVPATMALRRPWHRPASLRERHAT